MNKSATKRVTLYLHEAHKGKTIQLAGYQFTDGKISLYGVTAEVDSLSRYLGKCFKALPVDPDEGEKENGSSTVQETGLSDLGPEIRAEERQAQEVPANVGERPEGANLDERGDNTSGARHEDPRLPSPENRFDDTSTAKIDGNKLLEALGKLDPEVTEHWRADGLPKIDAVAKLYGSEGITRKDLQAVWPELTKEVKREEDLKEK